MLRNSFKYVNYSDLKKFASDFKAVYNAPNEKVGLQALADVREKWGKKYFYAVEDVCPFFQFLDEVRCIMYTTNIIEGLNRDQEPFDQRQFRIYHDRFGSGEDLVAT